jgi:outer membrane protein OmpA-like peptidoglycan-associated protein
MPSIGNRRWRLALGLCVVGTALVATPVSVTLVAANGQIYSSPQDISETQAILQHAGYLASGAYTRGEGDDATLRALQRFQTAHHLRPTGSIDYETTTQLLSHAAPVDTRASLVLEGVAFDTDTARLTRSSRVVLNRVARSMLASPDTRVRIDGHTDSTNTDDHNLRLSRARSAAVCRYLVEKGVSSSRLKEKGYGESRPIADNATAAGRAMNRRVELTWID